MMKTQVVYQVGIPERLRTAAARLYDGAFGAKLGLAIPSAQARQTVLADAFELSSAVAALAGPRLVGVAGFHTSSGSLTSGLRAPRLVQQLGWVGGLRALAVLALFERAPPKHALLMDGLCVAAEARGQGIGTELIALLEALARARGLQSLRLDVIDTNPDARRLYERLGFVATRTTTFGALRPWLGFGASTTMERALSEAGTPVTGGT